MTTVLVTGATDGLGRALARELVQAGDTVLLHGRNHEKGEAALQTTGAAAFHRADFARLDDVRALAAELPPSTSSSTTRGSVAPGRARSPTTGSSSASRSTTWPDISSRARRGRRA